MYLGFWGLDFEILMEKVEKKEKKQTKTGRKNRLPTGGQPCFFVGPKGLGETLAIFFLTFWDVMGNPMNGTEKNYKTDKTKIKKQCFLGTVSFFGGCDFGGLVLYLGFWGLDFEILMEKVEKKREKKQTKTGRKNRLPTGGQSCFFVGPKGLGETLAIFFLTFWDVMGNPMNGTGKNYKTDKTKIKKQCFLGTVSFFGGCDFGGLVLYLGFWGLDFEILMEKVEKKEKKQTKTGRKNRLPTGGQSCFFVGPKGLGETLAIFF